MTKEKYFEMCETLGTTPKDSEIPVEADDLPYEVQTSLNIFSLLQDTTDSFSGTYLGKNYSGINDLFELYEVEQEDRRVVFEYIRFIDNLRKEVEVSKQSKVTKPPR